MTSLISKHPNIATSLILKMYSYDSSDSSDLDNRVVKRVYSPPALQEVLGYHTNPSFF